MSSNEFNLNPVRTAFCGFTAGLANGLLGAGGGMLLIPMLSGRLKQPNAHAVTLTVMLILSAVSTALYLFAERLDLSMAWEYLPGEVLGGIAGAFLLTKVSPVALRKGFGLVALVSGVRLLLK